MGFLDVLLSAECLVGVLDWARDGGFLVGRMGDLVKVDLYWLGYMEGTRM